MSKALLVVGVSLIGASIGLILVHGDTLRGRRRRRRLKERRHWEISGHSSTPLPDLDSKKSMQRFTLKVVSAAEDLINAGQIDTGIRHLALAVALVRDTTNILSLVRPTLPGEYYNRLLVNIMDIKPGCRLPEPQE